MSRLLHAAARGARIQALYQRHWIPANYFHLIEGDYTYRIIEGKYIYRIHPDDEHLQYGPISTALREDALGLPIKGTSWFALVALHADGDLHTVSTTEQSLFLLLMAEALADEGM